MIHTLTTETLVEFAERVSDETWKRAAAVSKLCDPMDVFRTEAYYHARCQEIERLLIWMEGKRNG